MIITTIVGTTSTTWLSDTEIDPEGHATDLFSQWACDFIASSEADQAFFLYLAHNAPHTPIQPPEVWVARVLAREPGISERRAKLVALIEHMDAGIGQVLECLEQEGLTDSTIVVFTSDNGGQLDVGANNGPLRDGKGTVYEGGLKVPACIRWPGHVDAGTTTELRAMTMDIYPTLLDAVGAEYPETIDGVSFLPTLLGEQQDELRELWFFRRREGGAQFMGKTIEAVRMGDWKLLQNSPFTPMELYNLASDPLEQNNLIDGERQVFNQLSAALRRQIQRYGSVPWRAKSRVTASRARLVLPQTVFRPIFMRMSSRSARDLRCHAWGGSHGYPWEQGSFPSWDTCVLMID